MEYIDSIWQVGVIALIAGAMIGALAYRFFSPSVQHSDELKSELDDAKQELSSYKASVDSHFAKTSELVNDLTQNYVKVYQHLAEGAQTLGDSRALNNLLEQQQGKVLLTVDDETEVVDTAAVDTAAVDTAEGDESAEPGPIPEAPAEAADDTTGRATVASAVEGDQQERKEEVAETGAPETSIDSGEPEVRAGESDVDPVTESKKSAQGDSDAGARASADENKETGSGKPVIDIDKIDRASDGESRARAETASVVAEPTEGIEVPTTRH